jgi:long-chain acyl-CoA synthetase
VTKTYSELADQVSRLAAYVCAYGVRPGDRVGIMLGNRPEFAAAFHGVLHAGTVVVPLDPLEALAKFSRAVLSGSIRYRVSGSRLPWSAT